MDTCELCGKHEDERNIQEQMGYTICNSCNGLYSDEELEERMNAMNNLALFRMFHPMCKGDHNG